MCNRLWVRVRSIDPVLDWIVKSEAPICAPRLNLRNLSQSLLGEIIPWIKRFQPYYRIMNLSLYRLLHHLIIPVSFSNLRENRPQVYQQCDFINVIVEHPIRDI